MVTFRCKRSGNTVSFINANDIEGLRKHEGYDEVLETPTFLRIADDTSELVEKPKPKGRQKKQN